jgi:hypothetical protein
MKGAFRLREGETVCAADSDLYELTQELTHQLVALAALLARARRRLPEGSVAGCELQAIDQAFAGPIDLARKLNMAVHGDQPESRRAP